MNRLTLAQAKASNIPAAIGYCATSPKFLSILNEAQQRLVLAGGETGWWGGWARMVFNVNRDDNPYISAPRDVARLIDIDVCKFPVRIQNEFYEFLEAGVGLQARGCVNNLCATPQGYDRGTFPTFVDMEPGEVIRIYPTELADIGKKVLVQGIDTNDLTIYSTIDGVQVQGTQVVLASPFVDTTMALNKITGIQKDITTGFIQVYSANQLAGTQTYILVMQPGETIGNYRRYFLNGMPQNCCPNTSETNDPNVFQVMAMAKLEFIPAAVDSDYLIIHNLPALKHACMAVRYSEQDNQAAAGLYVYNMKEAVKLLNGELIHYVGKEQPAVNFAPWGTAKLERQAIGALF